MELQKVRGHMHDIRRVDYKALMCGRPVAIFASSPFHARELLKRPAGCETALVAIVGWKSSSQNTGTLPGSEVERAPTQALESVKSPVKVEVGAEPQRQGRKQMLKHIGQALLPAGKLYIIVSGWLSLFAGTGTSGARIGRWPGNRGGESWSQRS
jgi:hypothetical protein